MYGKFQNHYGWIETLPALAGYSPPCGFKTTTVGLRLSLLCPYARDSKKFQNHYGWIETTSYQHYIRHFTLFQNHYGWIETQ